MEVSRERPGAAGAGGLGVRGFVAAVCRLAAVCLLAAACGTADPDAPAHALPEGTPPVVSPAPSLVAGERPGDPNHELHRVGSPFLLPDGRLVVPLQGSGTIRVFSPEGHFLEAFGQPGDGPGEFSFLSSAWARGDTIEAFDSRARRVPRFVPGGQVETVPLGTGVAVDAAVPGRMAGGWIFAGIAEIAPEGRDQLVLHRFSSGGRSLGDVAGVEGFIRHAWPDGSRGPIPLSPRPLYFVHGDRLFVAETLAPRVEIRDIEGEPAGELSWESAGVGSPDEAHRIVAALAAERAAGEIEVPADFQPMWIGRDVIVGVRLDALGVESVRVYALERR